jgi:hypothetical protein
VDTQVVPVLRAETADRELEREPGATWRKGLAHDIDESISVQFYPPDGERESLPSEQRIGASADPIKEGDLFRAPCDYPDPAWPHVFVGRAVPPTVYGKGFFVEGDVHCWLPLSRRLDLDYVYKRMLDDPRFNDVRPRGDTGGSYAKKPWPQLGFARRFLMILALG